MPDILTDKDRLVRLNTDRRTMDGDVEWDIVEASPEYHARDDNGQFSHTHQIVVLRRVTRD